MQAFIYRQHKANTATRALQIKGANIAFFTAPVMQTSEFFSSDDGKIWKLKFFMDSKFEQTLFVDFNESATGNERLLGRAYWCDNEQNACNDARLLPAASRFFRGSDTLTFAKGEQLSANRTLLADRDGFAYFSGDNDQFKRIVLCQALAIAYVQVITTCMTRTTSSVLNDRTDETIALYENILRFNAAHYFTLPVQVERHELFAAWKVLYEHYHLKILSQELTQQLSDVAALLSGQREKKKADDERRRLAEEETHKRVLATQAAQEEKERTRLRELESQAFAHKRAREERADKRRGYVLSFAGLFLTAMSLLSLFQLTPKQFFDNVSQWKSAIWKSGGVESVESAAKANAAANARN